MEHDDEEIKLKILRMKLKAFEIMLGQMRAEVEKVRLEIGEELLLREVVLPLAFAERMGREPEEGERFTVADEQRAAELIRHFYPK